MWWELLPLSSVARVQPMGCLSGASAVRGVEAEMGYRGGTHQALLDSLSPPLDKGGGEASVKEPTQALGAASSLPGLCLIQAKLSEMEEVKPAR